MHTTYELAADTHLDTTLTPLAEIMFALQHESELNISEDGTLTREMSLPDKYAPLTVTGSQTAEGRWFRIAGRVNDVREYDQGPRIHSVDPSTPDFVIEVKDPSQPSEDVFNWGAEITMYYPTDEHKFRKLTGRASERDGHVYWQSHALVLGYPNTASDPSGFIYGADVADGYVFLSPARERLQATGNELLAAIAQGVKAKRAR